MKIILRTAAAAVLLLTIACGKDNPDLIEDTAIDISVVSDNIIINGGTKMEGLPPSSNGTVLLDIAETGKIAFLDEGFEVSLGTESTITGAYIQFKSLDGVLSDSYYDVNLDINNLRDDGVSDRGRQVRRKILKAMSSKVDDLSLDVDFKENMQTGELCYDISVYDASGNISAPLEVCATVEGWGGNAELVSDWSLTKEIEVFGNTANIATVGEPDCIPESSFDCNQGGTYQASYICYTTEALSVEFRQDGTYTFNAKESGSQINDESSSASCEGVYDQFRDDLISNGKWAYIANENRLVMIEYRFSENYRGALASDTYELGEAEIFLDGTVVLDGNSLVITQELLDETEIYHFEN